MTQSDWQERLAAVVAWQVRRYRKLRGLSAQQLADRCSELGFPLKRSVIANFESGRRTTVTVAELIVLAKALQVAPSMLVFPLGAADTVELLPGQRVPTWPAVQWFTGRSGFPPRPGDTRSLLDMERVTRPFRIYATHDQLLAEWDEHMRHIQVLRQVPEDEGSGRREEQIRLREQAMLKVEAALRKHRSTMRRLDWQLPPLPPELAHIDDLPDVGVEEVESE